MQVYFDNSATTRADADVTELVSKVMREDFGNPSSKHMKGVESERYLKDGRAAIASIMRVKADQIFFTSGGTESNNLAIIGAAMAGRRSGSHIITTVFEHDSVSETMKYLAGEGFEVTYLGVDPDGHISPYELRSAIRPDTILVSIMFVNNETGAVQDIAAAGRIIKEANPKTLFHVDAVQAFGKYRIYPGRMNIDLLSASAHKIHGPKGVGFLYVNEKKRIRPQILGGGQQGGMRSGTDNVPGIAGLALAARKAYDALDADTAHMRQLKDFLSEGIAALGSKCDGITVKLNSKAGDASAPHIVSASFVPVKSEVLLHALEEKGIYVSAGSACASNRKEKSRTLAAIGLDAAEQDCTLRFSFCRDNTQEEAAYTLAALEELLPVLARFTSH